MHLTNPNYGEQWAATVQRQGTNFSCNANSFIKSNGRSYLTCMSFMVLGKGLTEPRYHNNGIIFISPVCHHLLHICYITLKNLLFKVKESRKEQYVLVNVLATFHKMLNGQL